MLYTIIPQFYSLCKHECFQLGGWATTIPIVWPSDSCSVHLLPPVARIYTPNPDALTAYTYAQCAQPLFISSCLTMSYQEFSAFLSAQKSVQDFGHFPCPEFCPLSHIDLAMFQPIRCFAHFYNRLNNSRINYFSIPHLFPLHRLPESRKNRFQIFMPKVLFLPLNLMEGN
jgi:hypothetical protein